MNSSQTGTRAVEVGLEHQDLDPSFQQGCVPAEGLSGYRTENLGSPQATLSSTALHQDVK